MDEKASSRRLFEGCRILSSEKQRKGKLSTGFKRFLAFFARSFSQKNRKTEIPCTIRAIEKGKMPIIILLAAKIKKGSIPYMLNSSIEGIQQIMVFMARMRRIVNMKRSTEK